MSSEEVYFAKIRKDLTSNFENPERLKYVWNVYRSLASLPETSHAASTSTEAVDARFQLAFATLKIDTSVKSILQN